MRWFEPVAGIDGVVLAVSLELRTGAWLALAGAVIAWVGSWMSMRDESTPGAHAPDVPRRPAPG